jgi:alanine racemase
MSGDRADRADAVLEIDLAGIVTNWRLLAGRVKPARCAAVVKADAYGLGAAQVSAALAAAGCRLFFVATLDEGIALRGELPACCEIAVLNGPAPGSAEEFVSHCLIPVLNEPGQIATWAEATRRHSGPAAMLHVDTGMARLGLTQPEFEALAIAEPPVRGEIRWRALISHLACADQPGHSLNGIQRGVRLRAGRLAACCQLAASSRIFLGQRSADFVRPGAALYSVSPQPGVPADAPDHSTEGSDPAIHEVSSGDPVGYGAAHVLDRPARLATVAIGYADGWFRSLSPQFRSPRRDASAAYRPVSMDHGVDVRSRPVWLDLAALSSFWMTTTCHAATDAGTIGYEILTPRTRYHRVYRDEHNRC